MSQEKRASARILFADDDIIFRSLCVAKLKALGLDVVEAEDGVEAWHFLKEGRFALALLDVDMPNMDGVALVQCIRTHPDTRHMPVVMITSREDASSVRVTLQAGATSYLTKPVNWSLFTDHISHLLALSLGSGGAAQEDDRTRTVLAASRALNALYAKEIDTLGDGAPAVMARCRSLRRLGDLLARLEGVDREPVDLCQAVERVAGADVKVAIEAPDRAFTAMRPAFEALLGELVASAGLIKGADEGTTLRVERIGREVRVGLTVADAVGVDGDLLGFALQRLAVLAAVDEGEIFFDNGEEGAGFSFGATFDRPLEQESGVIMAGDGEVATAV